MKCLNHCLLAGVALLFFLFEPLSVYALSTSLDVLPRSTENESNISELPLDNTPSTDVKENSDNLDWLWNILGSGLVCAVITRALDYFKEKKIRLLSAADALFAAFSAAFSDDFLERDDSQWSVFQVQTEKYFSHILNVSKLISCKIDSNDIMPYYHLPSGNVFSDSRFGQDSSSMNEVIERAKQIDVIHFAKPTKRLYHIMDEVYAETLSNLNI